MNMFDTIAVVDTETTGFPPDASMVQVARTNIRLYPGGWEIEGEPQEEFVRPDRPIPAVSSAVHHILAEDCVDGMDQAAAVHFATTGATYVAAHNWEFDSKFLPTRVPAICTLKCARAAWPDLESHTNQAIRYALGLCLSPEERAKPAHRAGFDTWVTAHIMLELLKLMPVERLVKISELPSLLLRMPGGNKHRGRAFTEIAKIDAPYLRWIIDKSEFGEDVKHSARRALEGGRR